MSPAELGNTPSSHRDQVRVGAGVKVQWLGVWDDFRNWLISAV